MAQQIKIKSYGDIDSLKVGDHLFSPTIEANGENKFICVLDEYEIKGFLQDKNKIENITFTKYDVELLRVYNDNGVKTVGNTEEDRLVTNIRSGYATDDYAAKLTILKDFKKKFQGMLDSIDNAIESLKKEHKLCK